jgi:hypothetical protein
MVRAQEEYEEACRNLSGSTPNQHTDRENYATQEISGWANSANPGTNLREGWQSPCETTTMKRTVKGLEYSQDPHDVGLISTESGLPVLSREYQQEHYVPRESEPPTVIPVAEPARAYRPEEPTWAPGCSAIELVYSRIVLEHGQNQQASGTALRDHRLAHAPSPPHTMVSWAAPPPPTNPQSGAHQAGTQSSTALNQPAHVQ